MSRKNVKKKKSDIRVSKNVKKKKKSGIMSKKKLKNVRKM